MPQWRSKISELRACAEKKKKKKKALVGRPHGPGLTQDWVRPRLSCRGCDLGRLFLAWSISARIPPSLLTANQGQRLEGNGGGKWGLLLERHSELPEWAWIGTVFLVLDSGHGFLSCVKSTQANKGAGRRSAALDLSVSLVPWGHDQEGSQVSILSPDSFLLSSLIISVISGEFSFPIFCSLAPVFPVLLLSYVLWNLVFVLSASLKFQSLPEIPDEYLSVSLLTSSALRESLWNRK